VKKVDRGRMTIGAVKRGEKNSKPLPRKRGPSMLMSNFKRGDALAGKRGGGHRLTT